jgi:hypothetical protein
MKWIFIVSIIFLLPRWILAADFFVTADAKPAVNELINFTVTLNVEEKVNALAGTFFFDPKVFEFISVNDNQSTIRLWIDNPSVRAPGEIYFSGITPGGFSGKDIPILKITLKPIQATKTTVQISDVSLLLHDGKGTPLVTTENPLTILISTSTNSNSKIVTEDTEPPEVFTPVIAELGEANSPKVLIFETNDSGTGPVTFYVKEYRYRILSFFTPWVATTSPYLLKDQSEKSSVFVKAVDGAGNERLIEVRQVVDVLTVWIFIIMILTLVLILWLFWRWRLSRYNSEIYGAVG